MQPAARVAEVLAQDIGLRILLLHRLIDARQVAQIAGGAAVLPQHMHHVQPPAVDAVRRAQPVTHHAAFPAIDRFRHLRLGEVELRQTGVALPVERAAVRVEVEPAAIRRIGVVTGAVFALTMAVKPRVRIAGVVEYPVQHQFHAHLVSAYSQTLQRRVAAEVRIDLVIVLGIVLMHARRGKNRVQVQRRHAQLLQVRQFAADAVQIAAVKGRGGVAILQRVLPVAPNYLGAGRMMAIAAALDAVLAAAAGEAIGENLVEQLIRHPLGAIVRIVDGELRQLARRRWRPALRAEPLLAIGPQQLEAVSPRRLALIQRQAGLVAPHPLVALRFHHQQPLFIVRFGAQKYPFRQFIPL